MVKVDDLTVRYDGRIAISKISVTFDDGKFHFVMGPNGGGKTTLVRAIVGFLPYEGKIEIDGVEHSKYLKKNSIGYLAQRGFQFFSFPMTAIEVVEMGRYRFKENISERRRSAMRFLKALEMDEFWNKRIDEMSGGQQQRVLMARALATESKILVLDEPLTGIDSKAQSLFYDMIERIKEKFQLTVIMTTHDVGFVSKYADDVLYINKEIVPHDKAEKVLSDAEIELLYGPKMEIADRHLTKNENV